MFNDLLFPILPREGRAPLTFNNRVQKIGKITRIEALGEQERMEHDEERRVTGEQEREQHQQADSEHSEQYDRDGHLTKESGAATASEEPAERGQDGENDSGSDSEGKIKHLDIYI